MSASKSVSSRAFSCGVIALRLEPQRIPWWQSTSWAPARAARSNSSRWADTPVTTGRTSSAPGHLEAVRPVVVERAGVEQLVEEGDDLVAVGHRRTNRIGGTLANGVGRYRR